MRLVFKIISALCFVICVAVLSLTAFGSFYLPDTIVAENGKVNSENTVFRLRTEFSDGQTQTVDALNTQKQTEKSGEYAVLGIFPVKSVTIKPSDRLYAVPSGQAFGLKLYSDGVIVVGTEDVVTESGTVNPSKKAGIQAGDIISEVNGNKIDSSAALIESFSQSDGETMTLKIIRNSQELEVPFTLVRSDGDTLKAGLWIRDSFAGIGTMTFYTADSLSFGGLGHSVNDVDTGKIVPITSGEAVLAKIEGCVRGSSSAAGELYGSFTDTKLGDLFMNSDRGVFGRYSLTPSMENAIPIAVRNEIKTGDAQIISTVDSSGPQYFDIRIVRLYSGNEQDNKNMIIEVTDDKLISITGGIVQGMSGSPIIQNGMLVGAVTHVFINNPLQGYGIYAENMIKEINEMTDTGEKKAA